MTSLIRGHLQLQTASRPITKTPVVLQIMAAVWTVVDGPFFVLHGLPERAMQDDAGTIGRKHQRKREIKKTKNE